MQFSRRDNKEIYNNYYDIIEAETEEEAIEIYKSWLAIELYKTWLIENDYGPNEIEEAIELYKAWLIENDYEPIEIEEWQYRVIDYEVYNGGRR